MNTEPNMTPANKAPVLGADTNRIFGVYHKAERAYFSHFAADGSPVWSDANDARRMTRLEAEAQAACFIANSHNVQRRAVRL